MWYFYARSIAMASSPDELRELLEQLAALAASHPFTALCKSLVIQFAQELRKELPDVWTPEVAAAFGGMLKAMTAAFAWPHEQPAITKEWVSVLEQVVNFESSSEIICDALEDLAFAVDEHPLALCVQLRLLVGLLARVNAGVALPDCVGATFLQLGIACCCNLCMRVREWPCE
jgi:hypothetical protein